MMDTQPTVLTSSQKPPLMDRATTLLEAVRNALASNERERYNTISQLLANKVIRDGIAEEIWDMFINYHTQIEELESFKSVGQTP
jgi:hypothetical protein